MRTLLTELGVPPRGGADVNRSIKSRPFQILEPPPFFVQASVTALFLLSMLPGRFMWRVGRRAARGVEARRSWPVGGKTCGGEGAVPSKLAPRHKAP